MVILWGKEVINMAEFTQEKLEAIVRQGMEACRLPSASIGVYYQGQEYYCSMGKRGFWGGKVDRDTVYGLASVSKAFIAAAVMQLAEQGKLNIDEKVTKYLPGWAMWDEAHTAALTIRDALSHRSGLPRHDISMITNGAISCEETVDRMRYLEPAWKVGERFHYQNHMFALASILVEKVSGMDWHQYVIENIFKPLGMSRSYTKFEEFRQYDSNYAHSMVTLKHFSIEIKGASTDSCGCAGSLSASAHDLLQWARTNLGKGMAPTGKRIFSEASAAELHGPQTPIRRGEMSPYEVAHVSDQFYGFGWMVEKFRGEPVCHHGGTIDGYKTLNGWIPGKDFAFAVLLNQNRSPAADAFGRSLCDAVLGYDDMNWFEDYKQKVGEVLTAGREKYLKMQEPPATLPDTTGCEGVYEHPMYGKAIVEGAGSKSGAPLKLLVGTTKSTLHPSAAGDAGLVTDTGKMVGLAFPARIIREEGVVKALEVQLEEEAPHYIRYEKVG
jgi:CubicO group peptidase (beta-lactamase class C family)